MEACERCGCQYHHWNNHTIEDCAEELQTQIEKLKETFVVGYNRKNEYPIHTKMIWFEIDYVVYQGGYDDEKQLWFSEDGEEWSDLEDVFWMYMLNLKNTYQDQ